MIATSTDSAIYAVVAADGSIVEARGVRRVEHAADSGIYFLVSGLPELVNSDLSTCHATVRDASPRAFIRIEPASPTAEGWERWRVVTVARDEGSDDCSFFAAIQSGQ